MCSLGKYFPKQTKRENYEQSERCKGNTKTTNVKTTESLETSGNRDALQIKRLRND